MPVALHPAQAQGAEQADIGAEIDAVTAFGDLVLGDAGVVPVNVLARLLDAGRRFDEVALRCIEWLVEITAKPVGRADIAGDEQFAAQPVEPGRMIGGAQAEGRTLAIVGLQADTETQVVRPQRFSSGMTRRMCRSRWVSTL